MRFYCEDKPTNLRHTDDGYLRRTTFRELVTETGTTTPVGEPSDQALDGAIVSLHLCKNGRSGEHYIVGGTDGGVVAVWALQYAPAVSNSL